MGGWEMRDERLSEHFRLEEMCYSRTAMEKGIENIPGKEALAALKYIVTRLLEPLRKLYGRQIGVTSG